MPVEQYFNYGEQKGGLEDGKLELVVVGLEVVFDSDIDRFRAVVVEETSVVGFSDRDGGGVAAGSEFIDNLAGAHTGYGAHTVKSVSEGLTVENFTEDIELFDGRFEYDWDIVEVSPVCDNILEGILVEVEALDLMVFTIRFEEVVVIDNATERGAVGGMRGIGERDLRERFLFRSGGAAGL